MRKLIFILNIVLIHNLAIGQETISHQLWGNATLSYPKNNHLYMDIDIEPKIQITGGEKWANLDITPLIEYYPNSWIDLTGEVTAGYTDQSNDLNTLELTPRIGIRFHLFTNVWDYFDTSERIPLERLSLATFFRLESRNFWYSTVIESEHEYRIRARIETKIAINHDKLSYDNTVYLVADAEFYLPLGDDISERFASKARVRIGPGYRLSYANRFELLLIYDYARNTLVEEAQKNALAVDFRFKFYF